MLYDPKWEVSTPTRPVEPWRELLLKAADIIEQRGHTKYALEDCDGSVCLYGALNAAQYGNATICQPFNEEWYPEVTLAIAVHLGHKKINSI